MELQEVKNTIHNILISYKGVDSTLINFDGVDTIITAPYINSRQMEWASKKILDKFPFIKHIYFVGGWTTYVFSRHSLEWAGHKFD